MDLRLVVAALGACALFFPCGLRADVTRTVSTADELIAAVAEANAATETTVINLAAGEYAIPAASAPLQLTGPVQLVGADAETTVLTLEAGIKKQLLIVNHAHAKLEKLTVSEVDNSGSGAAVHCANGLIFECIFSGNKGKTGAHVSLAGGRLRNSRFVSSKTCATSAVYVNGAATIEGCTITGATCNSPAYGGGLTLDHASAVARNCLIYGNNNSSFSGGGVYMNSGTLEHCTVWGNVAGDMYSHCGDGVRYKGGVIRNCIVWGNGKNPFSERATANIEFALNNAAITNNIIETICAPGMGTIVADPRFVDPENGDFSLRPDSPAINAAFVANAADPVATDFTGWSRVETVDGSDALLPDIGCFEYRLPSGAIRCEIDASAVAGHEALTPTFTARVVGGDPASVYSCRWLVDGQVRAEGRTATIPFDAKGRYAVKAVVSDDGNPATTAESKPLVVRVGSQRLYCNTTGNGTWPYDTPETATNDVCEILASAAYVPGVQTEILVADGSYPINDWCAVLNRVKLVSADASVQPSFYGNHPSSGGVAFWALDGSLLEGFAVSDFVWANKQQGRSCVTAEGGSTIRRCTLDGNASTGSGAALTLKGEGTIGERLVISNNQTSSSGGGVFLDGKCVLRDSTISDNTVTANQHGGGIYANGKYAIVSNCVVRSNRIGTTKATESNARGGGIHSSSGNILIMDTKICGNFSYGGSGGVNLSGNHSTLVNCLIAENGARYGAHGFKNEQANQWPKLRNCTITANGVDPDGQVVATGTGAILEMSDVYNSIIAGNHGSEDATTTRAECIFNSCVPIDAIVVDPETGKDDNGNIKQAPGFVSGFRLSPQSPCKNNGSDSHTVFNQTAWDHFLPKSLVVVTDLAGNPRIKGRAVDMGCYEQFGGGMTIIMR